MSTIPNKEIDSAMLDAYKKAGHNAYFNNGFVAGVKFAINYIETNGVDKVLKKDCKFQENIV